MPGGPLTGTTVVDCSRAVAGPYAAMLLGDLGADVIKVESPGDGDDARGMTPSYGGDSAYFLLANRNKRSLTLDLKAAGAREVLSRLLARADVLLENFRPQAALRLGFDWEQLHREHPRLVYCSITGFGADGPLADSPAMDAQMQAYSGAMSVTGEPGRPPVRMGIAMADLGAAMYAVYGIQAALMARVATGRGQRVQTSLLEASVALCAYQNTSYWGTGRTPQRLGSAHAAMAPLRVFEVADGYLQVMAGTQKQWLALCDVLGLQELKDDPRFATNASRVANRDALHERMAMKLGTRTRAEWQSLLGDQGIQYAAVHTIDEALAQPQVARSMVIERPHAGLGTMKFTGFPVKLSDTPARFRLDPPKLGEQTADILAELGFCGSDIARLRRDGAV